MEEAGGQVSNNTIRVKMAKIEMWDNLEDDIYPDQGWGLRMSD
jgi:hypothetical protein